MINLKEIVAKKDWQALHEAAHEAGTKAATQHTPTPMRVAQRFDPLDDSSPIVKDYGVIDEGLCGFAWIVVKPANSSFALWLKRNRIGRAGYGGGIHIWVSQFGQSYERKEKYANAYALTLVEAGLKAYSDSRLD